MSKLKYLIGLFLYKMAPIKKNRFVFTSFNGHYSDNPKAISEKLHELYSDYEIFWLLNEKYYDDVPDYVQKVNIDSLKSFWVRGTAAAQVDNVYGFRAIFMMSQSPMKKFINKFSSFMLKKKKQPIFSTSHGTPIKKIGRDQIGNTVYDLSCYNTYLLVGDRLTEDVLKRVTFGRIPVSSIGSPRNDILYCDSSSKKKAIGIDENKKIVLYAPTFRNDGKDVEGKNVYRSGLNQLSEIDFDKLFNALNERFGGEWVMICRFHYHVSEMVDWEKLSLEYNGKIINGNKFDDMADYLAVTDLLISDYSSCLHDFALTKKPCFIYASDLVNYGTKERGFYIPLEELPYPISENSDELIDSIIKFDAQKYERDVDIFMERIESHDDGHACERFVDFMLKKLN